MTHEEGNERDIAETAAMWLQVLKTADAPTQERFGEWLTASMVHVRLFLEMTATEQDIERVLRARLIDVDAMVGAEHLDERFAGELLRYEDESHRK